MFQITVANGSNYDSQIIRCGAIASGIPTPNAATWNLTPTFRCLHDTIVLTREGPGEILPRCASPITVASACSCTSIGVWTYSSQT